MSRSRKYYYRNEVSQGYENTAVGILGWILEFHMCRNLNSILESGKIS